MVANPEKNCLYGALNTAQWISPTGGGLKRVEVVLVFRVTAHEDRTGSVVDDAVADTSHERPSQGVLASCAHHYHDGVHFLLVLDDVVPGILPSQNNELSLDVILGHEFLVLVLDLPDLGVLFDHELLTVLGAGASIHRLVVAPVVRVVDGVQHVARSVHVVCVELKCDVARPTTVHSQHNDLALVVCMLVHFDGWKEINGRQRYDLKQTSILCVYCAGILTEMTCSHRRLAY
jgi:hypothetical protein